MRHHLTVFSAVALALTGGLAGCGRDHGKPSWQDGVPPVAAPAATGAAPGAAATSGAATQGRPSAGAISAEGFGPYAIGAVQTELASAKLIGKVSTDRNGCESAKGTGKWKTPGLVFTQGRLEHIKITSGRVKTAEGVKVGTTFSDVKGKYADGKVLSDWVGATGWYATSGTFALLFRIKDDKVAAIEAGTAATLQFTFTDNQGC